MDWELKAMDWELKDKAMDSFPSDLQMKMGRTGPNVISVTRTLMVRPVAEQHTSRIITIAAKKREMEIKPETAVWFMKRTQGCVASNVWSIDVGKPYRGYKNE
ncbi:hypothetical protein JRO89_XS03G0024900 [Xanthoceras sorbifolium]|uniref:Uncharacterized protein n=1 Tax=Xanthoceras sorbifolium TaxID=99658 RepID=A0ABQ8I893_9ROSI|nr:hypothetical protein JRO89_XS03G0024900 [Xanthoceras sorbifolium]